MKRTRRKNVLRGIRGSLNRFLSILFIVALGSGFMAGLAATSPDMYESADRYMDDCRWYDADIKSELGFDNDDAEALRSDACADTVMPARVMDMVLSDGGEKTYTSRVFAFADETGGSALNQFRLTEGSLPQNSGECVVEVAMGRYFDGGLKIGDELHLSQTDGSYASLLDSVACETLKIVGFAESPMCLSVSAEPSTAGNGRVALYVYTTQDYFTLEAYTDLYVTFAGARELDSFGTEYAALADSALEALEKLGGQRAALRREKLVRAAQEQLDGLRAMVDRLEKTGVLRLELAQDTASRLQNNAMVVALLGSEHLALSGVLVRTQQNVLQTLQGLDASAGEDALAQARAMIDDGERKIDAIAEGNWIIRTREDNAGYSSYDSNVGKVAALSKIFPVFFFMVALLVALTTMTRLVEENRSQIGTLKALGFTNFQVLSEYLLYSLSSSLLGCSLGFAVGFRLFPRAISSAYSMLFTLPPIETPIRPDIALWVAPITVGSILLATLWACWSEFRACPAVLMQPKAPAAGKRIWLEHIPFLWKHIPFSHKVTCRNLFRYKKRFFMTVIGVAGCSALLLTGFGLRDSINDIVDKQFGEINRYELSMLLRDPDAAGQDDALREILEDRSAVAAYLPYADESGKVLFDGESGSLTLCTPSDPARMADFVTLRNRKSGERYPFPGDGEVVLTEKLCEELGIRVGDTVMLENDGGRRGEAVVSGITENYIASDAYFSAQTYRMLFGSDPSFDLLLCRLAEGADADAVSTRLMTASEVTYVSSSVSLKENFNDSIRSIDGVVLVLILAAGLLCMVVLYNLTNVNICERRKELATIRVLGFHQNEVERYIFRETNVLSMIGAAAGLFVGIWLHSYVVRTVEIDRIMFGRDIYPLSYLYALLIAMAFTLLVNRIMRRQIRRVDMVEAMKAND